MTIIPFKLEIEDILEKEARNGLTAREIAEKLWADFAAGGWFWGWILAPVHHVEMVLALFVMQGRLETRRKTPGVPILAYRLKKTKAGAS